MSEIANVVATEPILSAWGNSIRDRTVQRYDSASARTAANPTPGNGELSYLADAGEIQFYHSAAWQSLLPVGTVLPYSGNNAPSGFLLAQGQEVSRSTYAALNSLYAGMSYPYGNGNGSSTFNVPDLRQRYPMGQAAGGTGSTLGDTFGSINHVHSNPDTSSVDLSHTHVGANHNHGLPDMNAAGAHSHTAPSHTHTNPSTGGGSQAQAVQSGSGTLVQHNNHTHSQGSTGSGGGGATSTDGSHVHGFGNLHRTTNETGTTGSSLGSHNHSQGNTGTANPPTLVLNFLVKV